MAYSGMNDDGIEDTENRLNALIKRHMKFLKKRIDPDFGLLDKLRESGTLSWEEISEIQGKSTANERNSHMLDYILKKHKGDRLVAALQDANQMHIANYLIADAGYKSKFGGEWPLTANEISILDTNGESLTDLLNLSDLLDLLLSRNVINKRQLDFISSKSTSQKKTKALLEILRRRSLDDYKRTITCLHLTNQSHIAEILSKGGAIVRVHVTLFGDEVERTEEEIITRFKLAEARIAIMADIYIVAVEKGLGVVLYYHCKSLDALVKLHAMKITGELKFPIEKIFSQLLSPLQFSEVTAANLKSVTESIFLQLLHRSQIPSLTVTLSEDEYQKCRSLYPGDIKSRAVVNFGPIQMSDREENELRKIVESKRQKGDATLGCCERFMKNQSGENDNVEKNLDPKLMVLSFEKGNKMDTVSPANIGDNVGWWMVMHLETGQIGFVPRNRVVVDFASEDQSDTNFCHLLLEILDIILEKAYLQWSLNSPSKQSEKEIIRSLMSVDLCFYQRITRRRFKKATWRYLKGKCPPTRVLL